MNEPNGTPLDTYERRVKELEAENAALCAKLAEASDGCRRWEMSDLMTKQELDAIYLRVKRHDYCPILDRHAKGQIAVMPDEDLDALSEHIAAQERELTALRRVRDNNKILLRTLDAIHRTGVAASVEDAKSARALLEEYCASGERCELMDVKPIEIAESEAGK